MGILFSFNRNNGSSKHGSSTDALSDDEIYDLIEALIVDRSNTLGDHWGKPVLRITHDAVAKYTSGTPAEPFIMSYVSSHTSIRTPQVRRVLPLHRPSKYQETDDDCQWIIMDYVEGNTLHDAWPSMSWWGRLKVIWYIRSYIRQLHAVPVLYPDVPGPFDPSGTVHECGATIFVLTDSTGPYYSYKELADWFDRVRFRALVWIHGASGKVFSTKEWPKFDRSHPLTLCHMDLHMLNIIVGRDGVPWLIDWGNAGAYPAWLEYVSLTGWVRAPKLWLRCAGFMTGNHGKYVKAYYYRMQFLFDQPAMDAPSDYFTKRGIDID